MASLVYQTMPQGRIRLFRVCSTNGTLSVSLNDYAMNDRPRYTAISYAWGPKPLAKPILCNSAAFPITESLHEALLSFLNMGLITEASLLWADQLSINQADAIEKAAQVQKMWLIFQKASQVIAWLGPHEMNSSLMFERMHRTQNTLSDVLESWVKGLQSNSKGYTTSVAETDLEAAGVPGADDVFWPALRDVVNRTYFRRAWTFPEAVLANSLLIACGDSWLVWKDLSDIILLASTNGLERLLYPTQVVGAETTSVAWSVQAIENSRQERAAGSSLTYTDILRIVREKEVSESCDRIYSMRSLLPDFLRDLIPVDYRSVDEGRVTDLFVVAGRAGLRFDPQLTVLEFKSQTLEKSTLPSWCPDPRPVKSLPNKLPYDRLNAGIDTSTEENQAVIHLRDQSAWIRVSGMRLDRVAQVASRQWQWASGDVVPNNLLWNEECLELARIAQRCGPGEVPRAHLCALMFTSLSEYSSGFNEAEIRREFSEYLEDTRARNNGERRPLKIWAPGSLGNWAYFPTTLVGRAYFITEEGRIGIGHPDVQPGDTLACFLGGRPIYIIRQKANKHAHDVELIGDAFVDGLMDLATTRATIPEASEEMFVLW